MNIKLFFKIGFALIILIWVFRDTNIQNFMALYQNANLYYLVASFFLYIVTILLQGVRWKLFLRGLGEKESLTKVQFLNFTSMFFDLFVPGRLGSDAQRVIVLRKTMSASNTIASLILMRLHGLSLTLLAFFISLPWMLGFLSEDISGKLSDYVAVAVTILIVCAATFLFVVSKFNLLFKNSFNVVRAKFGLIAKQARELKSSKLLWFKTSLTYVAFLLMVVMLHYMAVLAVGVDLSFFLIALPIPLMLISAMLPITIHGRGITEILAILFWESPDVGREAVLALTLLIYGFVLFQGIIAGALWACDGYRNRVRMDNEEV